VVFGTNLVCAHIAFKAENLQKTFYSLPLITISWAALIAMMIIGCGILLVPMCSDWIAVIAGVLILTINVVSVIGAAWAGQTVGQIDEKVKAQTSWLRDTLMDAQGIMNRADSDTAKESCRKVYEALRYSDPMSHESITGIEAEIITRLNDLKGAVAKKEEVRIKAIADELVILIADRNNRCKAMK